MLCNMHGVKPKTSLRGSECLMGWGGGINLGRIGVGYIHANSRTNKFGTNVTLVHDGMEKLMAAANLIQTINTY